jgi:hypothetical protein
MAITVSGKNYSQISGCESTSDGGAWSGVDTPDGTNFKEGTYSLCGTLKSAGDNDAVFTPTSAVDMSGTGVHLRCWYICTSGGLLNTFAAGGIQMGISDGANECFWYLAGRDTYPGGWINLVVDVSSTPDTGIKPTAMNAITSITVRNNQTGGKNVDNVWIDNLCLCDGLIVYGDDGDYFDFEDIFLGDDAAALGIGIIRKIGGQYFSTGSIEYGDSAGTNGCKFQAKSQVLVFENRKVNADLYSLDVVDNGTGTTEFITGDKSGTVGVQGCTIRVADEDQTPKFDIDGATDTDVDNFKLYGTAFFGADDIEFPATATNVEIISCSFEYCDMIDPGTAEVSNCFFINTTNSGGALLLDSTSNNVSDSTFISDGTGHGVYITASGTYTFDNLQFISYGSTGTDNAAIYNNSGGAVVVNATNGSSGLTYKNGSGASTTVNDAKEFKFTLSPSITGYEWRIYEVTALGSLSGAVEKDGEESASADNQTYSYNYTTDKYIGVQIIGHANDYEESITFYTLSNANQYPTILLTKDDNN